MLINYDGRQLTIMILASQSINNNEGWEVLCSEILAKISEVDGHIHAPHHTEPSNTHKGAQQVVGVTTMHMDATSAAMNPANSSQEASSTMSSGQPHRM